MSEPVTTAKLMEDLHAVVRDAEALLQATASQTGERIEAIRERAQESLQQAKVRLAEARGDVLQSAREAAQATEDYLKQNPWQSVGVAAGVGLIIGLLIGRRD